MTYASRRFHSFVQPPALTQPQPSMPNQIRARHAPSPTSAPSAVHSSRPAERLAHPTPPIIASPLSHGPSRTPRRQGASARCGTARSGAKPGDDRRGITAEGGWATTCSSGSGGLNVAGASLPVIQSRHGRPCHVTSTPVRGFVGAADPRHPTPNPYTLIVRVHVPGLLAHGRWRSMPGGRTWTRFLVE